MRILLMADSLSATGGGEVMVGYLARQLQQSHTVALLTARPEATVHVTWNGLDVYQIHSEYHPRLPPSALPGQSVYNTRRDSGSASLPARRRACLECPSQPGLRVATACVKDCARSAHRAGCSLAFCYTKFHCYIQPEHMEQSSPAPVAHPERCRRLPLTSTVISVRIGSFVRISRMPRSDAHSGKSRACPGAHS